MLCIVVRKKQPLDAQRLSEADVRHHTNSATPHSLVLRAVTKKGAHCSGVGRRLQASHAGRAAHAQVRASPSWRLGPVGQPPVAATRVVGRSGALVPAAAGPCDNGTLHSKHPNCVARASEKPGRRAHADHGKRGWHPAGGGAATGERGLHQDGKGAERRARPA